MFTHTHTYKKNMQGAGKKILESSITKVTFTSTVTTHSPYVETSLFSESHVKYGKLLTQQQLECQHLLKGPTNDAKLKLSGMVNNTMKYIKWYLR